MYPQYRSSKADNIQFWSNHWSSQNFDDQIKAAQNSELIPLFKKYLPAKGKTLEAGCGQGIFVNVLQKLGYDIEGIDFDKKTISTVNKSLPKLKIRVGDVFKLDYPEDYFDSYISLGVIEHYNDRWREPLREAHRTLKKRGIVFVSVPHFNIIRRILYRLLDLFHKPAGDFYQYLFTPSEIAGAVRESGFTIKTIDFYSKSKTLMELPLFGKFFRKYYQNLKHGALSSIKANKNSIREQTTWRKRLFDALPNRWFAHMVIVIGQKE